MTRESVKIGRMITIMLVFMLFIVMISAAVARGFAVLNRYEIRRRAQNGDVTAKLVYPFFESKYELILLAVEVNILALTASIVLISDAANGFLGFIGSVVLVFGAGEIAPSLFLRQRVPLIVAKLSPLLHKLIGLTRPVNAHLAKVMARWAEHGWNMLYSRDQLLKMLEGFRPGRDGDLSANEVLMMRNVLSYNKKQVREVMTPRRMVVSLAADDAVGPQLLSSLYASGHSRFPVTAKTGDFQFIGTLFIRDLIKHKSAGTVKSVMHEDVFYIHEEQTLDFAMRAFLKSRHHLYIVVNNFEEFVGVLSLEDVLEEIIGKEIVDEFDKHGDLRAVAKSLAEKESQHRLKAR